MAALLAPEGLILVVVVAEVVAAVVTEVAAAVVVHSPIYSRRCDFSVNYLLEIHLPYFRHLYQKIQNKQTMKTSLRSYLVSFNNFPLQIFRYSWHDRL